MPTFQLVSTSLEEGKVDTFETLSMQEKGLFGHICRGMAVRFGESTLEDIKATVTAHQSIDATVETYSSQRVTEILGRSAEELVVRVYGDNTPVLRQTAELVAASIEGATGVSDARLDLPLEESTIEVDIDLERAQERALKPGDVRRRAATLLSGIVVGNLFEEQKVFDVVVWGAPAIRQTVDDI